jgi:hypothetical protein
VESGTVTRVNADGCTHETFSAGHGILEQPNAVHLAENMSSEPAETYVTLSCRSGLRSESMSLPVKLHS